MRLTALLLVLLCCLLPRASALADTVALYAAEVPLAVRERAAEDEAFTAALAQVLVRVTGQRDVGADEALAGLLARPRALVRQWSYTREGLWVEFDSGLVARELRALERPVWGAERPRVLIWLAIDDGERPAFVLGEQHSAWPPQLEFIEEGDQEALPAWPGPVAPARLPVDGFPGTERSGDEGPGPALAGEVSGVSAMATPGAMRELLDEIAAVRGLPLAVPVMDLADRVRVTPERLCGAGFESWPESRLAVEAVAAEPEVDLPWRVAVERYRADAILIGCALALGDRLVIDWTLQLGEGEGGERRRWRGDLAEGPNGAADVLARALAPVGRETGLHRLQVSGIDGLAAYGRLMRHLEGLSLIDGVDVERVSGETVHLSVRTRADATQLARALQIGRTLAALPGEGRYALLP